MFRPACFTVLAFLLSCLPAFAQAALLFRTGAHGSYMRVVFDWPAAPGYDVAETAPGVLLLHFNAPATLEPGPSGHGPGTPILAVEQVSPSGDNLAVRLRTPPGARYRHFLAGSRVVVDVFGDSPPAAALPVPSPKAAAAPAPVPDAVPAASDSAPASLPAMKPEPVEADKTLLAQARAQMEPHLITLSATETVNLAAFRRAGWLWLVADRPSLTVPPQIAGEKAALFGAFERHEVRGGVAWRLKLPPEADGLHLYAEGGGLVWRIVLTPHERDVEPVVPESVFAEENPARGGALVWPFEGQTKILELADPGVGDVLAVVVVEKADQFGGPARHYVEADVMESIAGLAVRPAVDDAVLSRMPSGVHLSRAAGLALSSPKDISRHAMRRDVQEVSAIDAPPEPGTEIRRIFDFDRWMMGGLRALEDNQRILMAGMGAKDQDGHVQDLLTLAKMNVSNDRGQEALGFLAYAAAELPDIAESPEFLALHGAAAALAGKPETAFRDLFNPALTSYTELDYWRAYTLAALEDWQQAVDKVPKDFSVLIGYPRPLLEKIGVKLAEVALRAGDVRTTEAVLAVLERDRHALKFWTLAAMDYLKGEAYRQNGETDKAMALWEPLTTGIDDLYRAKAGLALTMLQRETGAITAEQAIDRLEGLRYAWRGDELEARINFLLGRMYIEEKKYLKGFTILRDATGMSPDSDIGREITAYMRGTFRNLLLDRPDMNPLEAAELYEEFRELTPAGPEGDALVQKLAERLVEADLLERAAALLEHQVDYRLQGSDKARVAVRLGAIDLLDRKAGKAMKYLAVGRDLYAAQFQGEEKEAKLQEIDLLRARGLSQLGRVEEALALLGGFDPDPAVNRLRADIAWQAGLWDDAAAALEDLILDEALDANRPLTDAQAALVLNRAVALNLSGDRVALDALRRRYEARMRKTSRSRLFDVVTRPRQNAILADRDTIKTIVQEVDLFKDFLEAYRHDDAEEKPQ